MTERVYISVGPSCWGSGPNRATAVREMRKCWPTFIPVSGVYEVWSCPPGSYVSDTGQLVHPKDAAKPPILMSRGDTGGYKGLSTS